MSTSRIPAQGNGRRMLALKEHLLEAWGNVIDEGILTGNYVLGNSVQCLEQALQEQWRIPKILAVNSGTAALYLAAKATGIKAGDYVLVPALTFLSTALVVNMLGAIPVFIDVAPETLTIDPVAVRTTLQERPDIRKRARAVIPVHLYGQMAAMRPLLEIAAEYGLRVIEDACQSHGATYDDPSTGCTHFAGSMGDFSCFSLSGVKNVGAPEDAGALGVQHPDGIGNLLEQWRDLGRKRGNRYMHFAAGGRLRLGNFAAAGCLVQWPYLETWTRQRQEIAERYCTALRDLPLRTFRAVEDRNHVYYKFPLEVETPQMLAEVVQNLEQANVECEYYYPLTLPDQPVYNGELPSLTMGSLAVARHFASCSVCLPIYPELTAEEQQRVIAAVQHAYSKVQVARTFKHAVATGR